tara:strand:+ start:215 stop:499 length:285 start_codon:yes stop_codon:yes gene_type:complete
MKKQPAKISELTTTQYAVIRTVQFAQRTVKFVSFGHLKPHWVLPLTGHFCIQNGKEKNSKTGDTEPGLPSHRWCKEKNMIASRYKRMALELNLI